MQATEEEKAETARLRAKSMTKRRRLSKPALRKAIKNSFGNQMLIAKRLGVCQKTVQRYLRRWPELGKSFEEERSNLVCEAEDQLRLAIQRGEQWAIERALKNDGSRYAKKDEFKGGQVPLVAIQNNTTTFTPEQYLETMKKVKEIKGSTIELPAVKRK